jgi:hypothetical protein
MKVTEEKLQEWRILIEEKKNSGLKLEKFCQEKNITVAQYYYYQKMIKRNSEPKNEIDNEIIKPIKIINNPVKETTEIRFILPNSLQCILPRDMSLQEIKGILEVMLAC